jgi:hypothetical protein
MKWPALPSGQKGKSTSHSLLAVTLASLWQVGMVKVVVVGGNSADEVAVVGGYPADEVAVEVAFGLIREKTVACIIRCNNDRLCVYRLAKSCLCLYPLYLQSRKNGRSEHKVTVTGIVLQKLKALG